MGGAARAVIAAAAVSWALAAPAAHARPHRHAGPAAPVVVELYTAQGCASCPDADKVMADLVARDDVIALTFSVDYWDYLGTKDSFARPEFTARQRAYVDRLRVRDMYTPEAVVDGRAEGPAEADKVDALIAAARPPEAAPRITPLRRGVRVGGAAPAGLRGSRAMDVWLVRWDPRPRRTRVKGDDGKTHVRTEYAVVRSLEKLGAWRGGARDYTVPPAPDGLKTVVLVQAPKGGRILAAARVG